MITVKHAYRDAHRLKQIVDALFKSGLGYYIYQLKLKDHLFWHQRVEQGVEKPADLPKKIRAAIDELGGTFIKLGQLLSLRPDLIPKEYCDEFSRLQDNVSNFSFDEARRIIEGELKHKTTEIFSHFEKEPIASASIGQVHKARLLNGVRVVVKVQRPGIKELMDTDIDLLYHLAELLQSHVEELKDYNLKGIVDEFKRYTLNELDYLKECRNIEKFYNNFLGSQTVKVPKVHWDFTTKKVLVMGYIEGVPIDDKEGLKDWNCDEKIISKNLADCFLKQIFEDGFFHADPHPANVFVLPGNKIALLDYGICGSLTEGMKEKLVDMLVSLVDRDINTFVDGFFEVGMIDEKDETLVNDIEAIVEEYAGANIDQIDFVHLFNDLVFTARRHNISLPVDFILLAKAIITIEGVGQQLNPEFNLSSALHDYTDTITARRLRPSYIIKNFIEGISDFRDNVKLVPRQINEILLKLKRGELGVHFERKDLVQLEMEIDRSSNRVSLGVIIAALIVASALVLNVRNGKWLAVIGFLIATFLTINLFISVIKERRIVV
ncbi:AarF/ABC1/UbiB kinase family protein [Candidatus Woesearchaeota archaeon]|nr:AarF/ABC1/UbiB kinase family protein [Candidatus Woesearchaeota archaeon]